MPAGFSSNVTVYAWGAGGATAGGAGGGGGYATSTLTINAGDTVEFVIGGAGKPTTTPSDQGASGGLGGSGERITGNLAGGQGGKAYSSDGDNDGPYAGGGGGGATAVIVNGTIVVAAAGGGGGGGVVDDGGSNSGGAGIPGGSYTALTANTTGGAAGPAGGGGGGGYLGGAGGTNASGGYATTGGSGGQNYGTYTEAGVGSKVGGTTSPYFPLDARGNPVNYVGNADEPGYIVMVFTYSISGYIKQAGAWKQIQNMYYKKDGIWKAITNGYIKNKGAWVPTIQSSGIQLTTYKS